MQYRNVYQVQDFRLVVIVTFTDSNTINVLARCNELEPKYREEVETNNTELVGVIEQVENNFQNYLQAIEIQTPEYFKNIMQALQFREVNK